MLFTSPQGRRLNKIVSFTDCDHDKTRAGLMYVIQSSLALNYQPVFLLIFLADNPIQLTSY